VSDPAERTIVAGDPAERTIVAGDPAERTIVAGCVTVPGTVTQ
jgi:hypothetical protein